MGRGRHLAAVLVIFLWPTLIALLGFPYAGFFAGGAAAVMGTFLGARKGALAGFFVLLPPYLISSSPRPPLWVLAGGMLATAALGGFVGWRTDRHQDKMEKRMAEERLLSLGQLAATAAHEIRNPLTTAMGFLSLVQMGGEVGSPEVQRRLTIAQQELSRVATLVTEFMALAKPHTHVDPVDLTRLVQVTLDMMDVSIGEGVTVRWQPPEVPIVVAGDGDRLQQVLANLIGNAVQAMQGHGTLSIELTEERDGVRLGVIDTGPGIPPEVRERIFEPFFTTKSSGTGLGLAICRKIVEEHGGSLTLDTGTEGTRFWVHLKRDGEKGGGRG